MSTIEGDSFMMSVQVIEKVVVHAEQPPWVNHYWLPLTNLDLLLPPFDISFFFCFKKPTHESFNNILNTLKTSLSRALTLYRPLSGEIQWNAAVGENQIHCNNQGVDFIQAVADVDLKELNFHNPDECIEGKLMPNKPRGVLAIQVTELKCGGIVIALKLDHRVADGYSSNMFISSWADLARSETPSMIPSFERSHLNPRSPPVFSSSIDEIFALYRPPSNLDNGQKFEDQNNSLVNRLYHIEGEQIKSLQLLASENGSRMSKLEAFASFLWKEIAMSMEKSENRDDVCNMAIVVDGRRRFSEGDGVVKEKLMDSHFGNVLTVPYGSKTSKELNKMSLSNVACEVHEFLQCVTRKDHFLDLIDWVEERRSQPLVAKAFASQDMSVMVSAGQRFRTMVEMDFGCGKAVFGSCHVPSERKDCFVMTLGSPINKEDWVVYMHMPLKHINYIEAHASHVFKPLKANYLNI